MTQSDRLQVFGNNAVKSPARAATTANITLSGEQTIDGVACVTGDRVLVKDQTAGAENGIYIVDTGTWPRASDWDGAYDVRKGTITYVHSGSTNTGFWFVSTADPITVGTTSVTIAGASSVLAVISAFGQTLLDDDDADAVIETLADGATSEASPAVGDLVLISDITANDGRKVTIQSIADLLAALIQTLTNKTLTSAILAGTTDVSGGQLKFPATQNPSADANTLDDYEEGTWTPVLDFNGSTTGITYSTQVGTYTRIGDRTILDYSFTLTSKGGSSGVASVSTIPFPLTGTHVPVSFLTWHNMTATLVSAVGRVGSGVTTKISLWGIAAAATSILTQLTNTSFADSSIIQQTVVYKS